MKYFFLNILIFCVVSISEAQNNSTSPSKPNVVFILADDLGINALHCYGNEFVESPNIDELFSEGMHFTNGYSNDPTCAPSRASIMSGQYVPRHKVYRVVDRYRKDSVTLRHMRYLPPEINRTKGEGKGMSSEKITIPETLHKNGYTTAGFGKWHLGRKSMSMKNQGFDESVEITGHYKFKVHSDKKIPHPDSLYSADYETRRGIEFMEKAVKDKKPFFLYLPYYLVHKPLEPKPRYLKHFREKYKGNKVLKEEDIKVLAMIKSLDESVGQVMQAIKSLNIERETVVIFVSDNGHYKTDGELFNKPYRGFKGSTYEGGIRVPYIFKWPGKISAKSKSREPVIHVDLYPTILGLTRTPRPENYVLDGKDLSPVLLGKTDQLNRDALIWQYTNYARYQPRKKIFASSWVNVIQKNGFKLTEEIETGKFYLYYLEQDPYETKNVVNEYPEEVALLKKALEKWKNETKSEVPVPNPDYIGNE